MSFELLIEVPNRVVKIFPVDESINNLNLKSATVVILTNSIVVINNETGNVYRNFEPIKGSSSHFIDCVYLKDARAFLAAVSDSTLLLFPEGAKKASDYQKITWRSQPVSLHCFNGRDVVVCDANGGSCQFTLQNDNSFPTISAAPQLTKPCLASVGNSRHYSTISSGPDVTEAAPAKKGKKAASVPSSSGSSGQLQISSWRTRTLLEGSTLWLSASGDSSDVYSSFSIDMSVGESLFTAVAHRSVDSVSLILHNAASGSSRWVKVNISGEVLLDRQLSGKPCSVVEVGDLLWMVHDHCRVSQWDIKYGVEVKVFNVGALPNSSSTASYVLPYGYGYSSDASDSSTGFTPCHLLVSAQSTSSDATSLHRHTLTSDAPRTTLCSAIGKLAASTGGENGSEQTFNISIADDTKAVLAEAGGESSSGRVLAGLPGPMKRKLKQIQTLYDNQVKLEAAELSEENGKDSPEERFAKKYRRFYLDIPEAIARAFLVRLESADFSQLVSSDWDLVKVLVRSGTLSLASNPSLIEQATLAHRFDVLAQIVRHVTDLTERQCVRILRLCLFASDKALSRLQVVGGVIQWGSNANREASESTPAAALISVDSLLAPSEGPKQKTPKKKGGRASAKDFFVPDALDAAQSNEEAVDKRANAISGEASPASPADKRSLILRAMIESVVHRSSAFSSVLLSEAVRTLSPSTCALFLRLFAHTLRGLTAPVNDTQRPIHLGAFGDDQVKRSIAWIEALLDGNFSAIALHATVHAPTRRALALAMKAVSQSEEAVDQAEAALGLWTHISRVIYNGSEQAKPIPGLYQMEQLTF